MLIFDSFPSALWANKFKSHVEKSLGRKAYLCKTHEEVDKFDLFPFELSFPVVCVERDEDTEEEAVVIGSVDEFKGKFAGT